MNTCVGQPSEAFAEDVAKDYNSGMTTAPQVWRSRMSDPRTLSSWPRPGVAIRTGA